MNSAIIIMIIEGNESYTETVFFQEMGYYFENKDIFPLGFHKAVRTSPMQRNKAKFDLEVINYLQKYKIIDFFFIADGDVDADIPAIDKTYDFLKKLIIEYSGGNIENISISEMIIPKNKKFESEIDYHFTGKGNSHKYKFNNFASSKGILQKGGEINKEKLREYFSNTVYGIIIEKILSI